MIVASFFAGRILRITCMKTWSVPASHLFSWYTPASRPTS